MVFLKHNPSRSVRRLFQIRLLNILMMPKEFHGNFEALAQTLCDASAVQGRRPTLDSDWSPRYIDIMMIRRRTSRCAQH
jgi:hypothetical protein